MFPRPIAGPVPSAVGLGSQGRLFASKLVPEMLPSLVDRPRLTTRLSETWSRRVGLVCAAAGSGKSALLSSCFADSEFPVVWYRLDEQDGDPFVFVEYLTAGVRRHDQSFWQTSDRILRQYERARTPSSIPVRAFVEELASSPLGRIAVVLDDFHRVPLDPADNWFGVFLASLPPNVRVFIASRGEPRQPELARLRQYGQVVDLDDRDLAFTDEETQQLLQLHGVVLDASRQRQLLAVTEGWPAALSGAMQRLRGASSDREVDVVLADMRSSARELDGFFGEYILNRQPPDVRTFLLRTSVLEVLSPDACTRVAEIPHTARILRQLHDEHLFVSILGAGEQTYRYHALFREYLQRRLLEEEGPAGRAQRHLRAAAYYREGGNAEHALEHLCAAGAWDDAAHLLHRVGLRLLYNGRHDTLSRFLDQFPRDVAESDPWLLLLSGRVLGAQDRFRSASGLLQRAQELFAERGDLHGVAACLAELGGIAYYQHDSPAAVPDLEQARLHAGDDAGLQLEALANLIVCYRDTGALTQALRAVDDAVPLIPRLPRPESRAAFRANVRRRQAMVLCELGAFPEALRALDEATNDDTQDRERARNRYVAGWIELSLGRFVRAHQLLDEAMVLAEANSLPGLRQRIVVLRAEACAQAGDLVAAEKLYRVVEEPSNEAAGVGYLLLLRGESAAAIRVFRQDLATSRRMGSIPNQVRALTLLGASLRDEGSLDMADAALREAMALAARHELRVRLAGAQLHVAALRHQQGSESAARAISRAALGSLEAWGTLNATAWDPRVVALAVAEAWADGAASDHQEALVASRLGPVERECLRSLLRVHGAPPQLAARVARMLEQDQAVPVDDPSALVRDCQDPLTREHLLSLVQGHIINERGLALLRQRFGLTWRESEIFATYYLVSCGMGQEDPIRAQLAEKLCVTENTLRFHITTIRRKLGLMQRKGSLSVYQWAVEQGIAAGAARPGSREPVGSDTWAGGPGSPVAGAKTI